MRKLLIIVLLLTMQLSAQAQPQIKVIVTLPDSIAGKGYVQNLVDQAFKNFLGTVPVTPPVVVKPACEAGPDIVEIKDVTSTSLTARFHGKEVYKLVLDIFNITGKPVHSDTISPGSSYLSTRYSLAAGTYTLRLRGVNCTGGGEAKTFVIKNGSTGEVTPDPDIPVTPVIPGNFVPQTLAKGMPEHMNITFKDSANSTFATDNAPISLWPGYRYRYIIGNQVINQDKPLKNCEIANGNAFRIVKAQTKIDDQSLTKWGAAGNEGGWWDKDFGQGFSYNNSFSFGTYVRRGPQDAAGFLNHIPQNFDPEKQLQQWTDIAPDMVLPKGHVWIARVNVNLRDVALKKGVTHLSKYDLPWAKDGEPQDAVMKYKDAGLTYNDVPRPEHFMQLGGTGQSGWVDGYNTAFWKLPDAKTEEYAIRQANWADINDVVWVGETMEGESSLSSDKPTWGFYYKRLRERYKQKWGDTPYYIAHNYFNFPSGFMVLGNQNSRQYSKDVLRMSPEQLPHSDWSPGGTLSSTNLIVYAVYKGAPDLQLSSVLESIFCYKVWQNMGYNPGAFLFGVHEFRPNNSYEYKYPEGTFYHQDKIPLDPATHIAHAFTAQVHAKLFIEWGGKGKSGNKYFGARTNGVWQAAGSTNKIEGDVFPEFSKDDPRHGNGAWGYSGSEDLSYFGTRLYYDTFAQVDGGTVQWLKFQLDKNSVVNPSQFSVDEVIDAYHEKRGYVYSVTKSGKTAWYYYNAFADNKAHTLTVVLPNGKTVSQIVAGNGIHTRLEK